MTDNLFHQDPEFYPNGFVTSVTENGVTVEIRRDGEALLYFDPHGVFGTVNVVRTPQEFKEAFPYGIPSDEGLLEWRLNAWFDCYTEDGEHLDCVSQSLDDAVAQAKDYLARL